MDYIISSSLSHNCVLEHPELQRKKAENKRRMIEDKIEIRQKRAKKVQNKIDVIN